MFEPDSEPPWAIVVVSASDDHPTQRYVRTKLVHALAEAGTVSGCHVSCQVADNVALNLNRDGVCVVGVVGLRHKDSNDAVTDAVARLPTAQRP
jgi:hypothetical protein